MASAISHSGLKSGKVPKSAANSDTEIGMDFTIDHDRSGNMATGIVPHVVTNEDLDTVRDIIHILSAKSALPDFRDHYDLILRCKAGLDYLWRAATGDRRMEYLGAMSLISGMWHFIRIILVDSSIDNILNLDSKLTECGVAFMYPKKTRKLSNSDKETEISNLATVSAGAHRSKKAATQSAVEGVKEDLLEIKNKFEALNDDCEDPIDTEVNKFVNSTKDKINKIDPFWILKEQKLNWRNIAAEINKLLNDSLPLQDAGKFIKIFPKTIDQFRAIQKLLLQHEIKSYAMNPKNERPLKILLKGIPTDIPIEEIRSELINSGYSVQRVSQLKKFSDKSPLPIFLCNLFPTENVREIYNTREFLGFIIKVETYIFKGTKQCYNCLNFNHSSENCYLDPKCLKCAGGHKTVDCKKPLTEKPKCANCGGEHPANFTGCVRHPKFLKEKRRLIKTIKNSESVPFNNPAINEIPNLTDDNCFPQLTNNPTQAPVDPKPHYSDKLKNINRTPDQINSNLTTIPTSQNTNETAKLNKNSELNVQNLNNFILKLQEIERLLKNIKLLCTELKIDNIQELIGNSPLDKLSYPTSAVAGPAHIPH